jgi:hypothetical protein
MYSMSVETSNICNSHVCFKTNPRTYESSSHAIGSGNPSPGYSYRAKLVTFASIGNFKFLCGEGIMLHAGGNKYPNGLSRTGPPKSPRVPRNMVHCAGTIVGDVWRWRPNIYRTKRLSLLLTPAEEAVMVQMAEAEGGPSQSALLMTYTFDAQKARGDAGESFLGQVFAAEREIRRDTR